MRSSRFFTSNEPKPETNTGSPDSKLSPIACKAVFTSFCVSSCERPTLFANAVINSLLFIFGLFAFLKRKVYCLDYAVFLSVYYVAVEVKLIGSGYFHIIEVANGER